MRWEPPLEGQNGIITGYKIRYKRRGGSPQTITTESNQRFYVLSNLDKHVAYLVRISALNVNGTGPWTEWMTIETYENDLDESVVPSEPIILKSELRIIITFFKVVTFHFFKLRISWASLQLETLFSFL